MSVMRRAARLSAYLIATLLALVWSAEAAVSLANPLYDLGRPLIGDAIIRFASLLQLSPHGTLVFAHLLAGLKLFVGVYLFMVVCTAMIAVVRGRASDDALLDVGLLLSALASVVAASPTLTMGGEPLQRLIGELMLAAIASAAAIHGRGFLTEQKPKLPTRGEALLLKLT